MIKTLDPETFSSRHLNDPHKFMALSAGAHLVNIAKS